MTLQDIERIRISREQLLRWLSYLYFDKTIIGTFVKLHIGNNRQTNTPMYLMCEVVDVIT